MGRLTDLFTKTAVSHYVGYPAVIHYVAQLGDGDDTGQEFHPFRTGRIACVTERAIELKATGATFVIPFSEVDVTQDMPSITMNGGKVCKRIAPGIFVYDP